MQNPSSKNPLSGLMRRPKLKVKLPSRGMFWRDGSIDLSEINEYDVYSLTARDELTLKNPAAVAGGKPIVTVIESCVPSIKDAWAAPSVDIDAILIAIRIASLGNIVSAVAKIDDKEFGCSVDLYDVLDQMYNLPDWDGIIELDGNIKIYLCPVTFKTLTGMGTEAIETQRIMNIINDESANEEQKIEVFKKSFSKLTNITMGFVQQCVYRIDAADEVVTNPKYINEFLENCDSEIFTYIRNKIDELAEIHSVKPVKIPPTEEMIEAGITDAVDVDVNYEVSNFFAGDTK